MPPRIRCQRCGACSRTTKGIKVTAKEMKALEGKVPLEGMQNSFYTARVPVGKNGSCVALEQKGSKGHCKIYRVRPSVCRQLFSTSMAGQQSKRIAPQ